mmetsp:Transcript_3448/g.5741  ORF Transcript_3448/g.5741 Transcript_3448/m.5741 type:complete len:258 (+) Transcript_3448:183-956(+)|eukprot:CAMPEP_0119014070 /NCGR_PEP_ID=MMETSP1176-20130426/9337_1 /TAXON_ID=265551 /ORGANISM="Synedropsis recta cf, Strain CCMP1620" /LENGTH=257 /DNA_ID=CAMNT_0006967207 /DNA_START=183 /DNA_END=956 /DNA_ORIENTATION=+
MTQFEIKDSVAFVTGTNKKNGIGRAIVHALLAADAKKVYATARNASQLEDLAAESDGRVVAVSLDLTDLAGIRKLGEDYPDVTLVVNNAGYSADKSTLDGTKYAEQEIAINYIAPLAVVNSFSTALKSAKSTSEDVKGSAIVNVASITSLFSFPFEATYSASKAAAHSLTQGQRRDLASSTLVIGVYPGPIDTDLAAKIPMDKVSPSVIAKAVVNALKTGTEDVFPDPTAVEVHEAWQADAKALERKMAQPMELLTS